MNQLIFVCCILFTIALSQSLTTQQRTDILNAHNKYRKLVSPPALVTIPDLVWDTTLATMAENWVNQCQSSQGMILDRDGNLSSHNIGDNL